MKRTILMIILTCLMAVLSSCSEKEKNPVGFGLVDEEVHWQVERIVTQNVLADSTFPVNRGDGMGFYLLVGSWQGQEARTLMTFEEDLPDTLDWPLLGATLNLTAYTELGEDSITISAHALQTPWSDSTATWDDPWSAEGGDFVLEPIAQGAFAMSGGNALALEFNAAGVELAHGWLQGQPNNGIILIATGLEDDQLKYFYSEDTAYDPILSFTFAAGDTLDTTMSIDSDKDIFIAPPLTPVGDDLLLVSDGFVHHSWLRFDISPIPESSFINMATLSLSVQEFDDPQNSMTVRAYPVSDIETLDYDSSPYGSSSLYSGKELADFDITEIVQNWVYGADNAGLILRVYPQYSDLSRAIFFSPSADSTHRPTLSVIYTLSPGNNRSSPSRSREAS